MSLLLTALSVRNRVPQIEVAVADNAVALVVRVLEELTAADRELLLQFARDHDVQIYVQPGGYDTIAPLSEVTPLEYRLPQFDVTLRFQPNDFVQVNGELNAQMVARAVELLAPAPGERLLDLFCGLGNFSLPLARSGAHVVGVEGDAGLVARARGNAELNGIDNIEFVCGDLAQPSAGDAAWARRPYDKVLLDPPRAGALEVLPIVARCGAKVVLYISCHPGSLARDAGILVHEHGFTLRAAGVMDMFPHTAHVESAALFTRGRDHCTASAMTLGPLMIDVQGTTLSEEDRDLLQHPLVGAVILFTRNFESIEQLERLVADIRAVRTPPLLVTVDHEGGRVQRFRKGFTVLPPMRTIGRQYDLDPAAGPAARAAMRLADGGGAARGGDRHELRAVRRSRLRRQQRHRRPGISSRSAGRGRARDRLHAAACARRAWRRRPSISPVTGPSRRTRTWRSRSTAGRSPTWTRTSIRTGA